MNGLRRGVVTLLMTLGALPATATVRIDKKAREFGYATEGCAHCHTFDTTHMKQKKAPATAMTTARTNCQQCHPGGLPKRGLALYNTRGRWLLEQKERRKAIAVDPAWLKDYPEPRERPIGSKK